VRNPLAVARLPQFQVAGYSLLLLASLLTYGFARTPDYLPLPKWRTKSIRPSLLDLLNLLRDQLFEHSADSPLSRLSFARFMNTPAPIMKPSKLPLASDTLCTVAA